MKLTGRLTLVLVLVVVGALAVEGYLRIARDVALFKTDMERDHHLLGQALGAATLAVWRTEGEARALQVIERAELREGTVRLRWVHLDPGPGGESPASGLSQDEAARLRGGKEIFRIAPREGRDGMADTFVPLNLPGARPAALELSESLTPLHRYTLSTAESAVRVALLITVLFGIAAAGLGIVFVGKPVNALVEQARRVGSGDLSGRLDVKHHDEIAELAREINLMCERLAEANERANQELAARLSAIDQLRHADRLATVGKLASGVAHELGTPLNVVSGRAKMIASDEVTGRAAAECGRIITQQAARMATTIRQLLDFARRHEPRRAREDLIQIAGQTVAMLAPMAAKRGVRIDLENGGAPLVADVDAGQIQQALTNLVVNGIQSMEGGGLLTVRLGRRRARRPPGNDSGDDSLPGAEGEARAAGAAGAEGDFAFLSVEDRGVGIPEDAITRVFEPFFTTKGVGEGTGLGLSVAYGLVRDHAGWIDVQSVVGKGSRFTIFLPEGRIS